jgi:hypothetical protein
VRLERVEVRCREHYQAQQEPLAFSWRGRDYLIQSIVDRWVEGYVDPQRVPLRYFKVLTSAGESFILRYNELFGAWAIVVPPPYAP